MAMPEEIQSVANSFLELAPGVSANPGNLKMLLRWILEKERGVGWENASDEMAVIIYERGTKKKPELHAVLYGPLKNVTPAGSNIMTRDLIADTKVSRDRGRAPGDDCVPQAFHPQVPYRGDMLHLSARKKEAEGRGDAVLRLLHAEAGHRHMRAGGLRGALLQYDRIAQKNAKHTCVK